MKLSRPQFERLLQEKCLVLSLIGMSNIGKTHWSKKLNSIGFRHFNCDDLIESHLAPVLKKLGYSGIADVSRWLGRPYEGKFSVNQKKYLTLEKAVMENIFTRIKNCQKQNIVIDTTGSVAHAGGNICSKLKQCSLVVYIEANENMKEEMFKKYLKKPKPVIFGDVFDIKKNETLKQALKRCYQELLNLRGALYTEYADIIIPRGAIERDMNARQLISIIGQSL